MTSLNNAGDTIVEVLIAITVLSFILGGAYIVINRNAQSIRDAQERSEAVTLARGQLETLRKTGSKTFQTTALAGNTFCFDANSSNLQANSIGQGSMPALETDNLSITSYPNCSISPQGGVTYFVAIDYSTITNAYTVHVRWERVGGGRNEANLMYRMLL